MKMVKKVLMGLALCTAFSFVGCSGLLNGLANGNSTTPKPQSGNDEEKEITGTASEKKVGAVNDTDTAKRIYDATTLKHSGALVKVTFNNPSQVSTGKMGLMFDLKTGTNGGHDFFIIGVNPLADKANFYVSKFENVTDYQASNFGTSLETNPAVETEYVKLGSSNFAANEIPAAADDGSISFTIYYKLTTDGNINWAVLDMEDTEIKKYNTDKKFDGFKPTDYKVLRSGTIISVYPASVAGKESLYYLDATKLADGTTAKKQNYIGYYTQIAPNSTLDGKFYIPGTTFHEPEDAE